MQGKNKMKKKKKELRVNTILPEENGSEPFSPVTGEFKKYERKFVCLKPHLMMEWLKKKSLLHFYYIEQIFLPEGKYRKYFYDGLYTYTFHKKNDSSGIYKNIHIKEITRDEYDAASFAADDNCIGKVRFAYDIGCGLIFNVDDYYNRRLLIEVWGKEESAVQGFESPEWIYEVTGNLHYSNEYMAGHDDNILSRGVYIIEGTDLCGKTTAAKRMSDMGYLCLDRDQEHFSRFIEPNISRNMSAFNIYKDCWKITEFCHFAVLYADNENILKERLEKRKASGIDVSGYDEMCCEYNRMYLDVLEILKKKMPVMPVCIDGKSTDEIVSDILTGCV